MDLRLQQPAPSSAKPLTGKPTADVQPNSIQSTVHHRSTKVQPIPIKPATAYIPSAKPVITTKLSETAKPLQTAVGQQQPLPPTTSMPANSQPSQPNKHPFVPQSIQGTSHFLQIKPAPTHQLLQPTTPAFTQPGSGSVTQLLATLGSRSVPLQQALAAECTPSALPLSLVQAATPATSVGGFPLVPEQIPLTARVSMFQVSLLNLGLKSKAVELSQFYQLQSSKLESDRIVQLQNYSTTPHSFPAINKYFDMQHHALLDNLNLQLAYLQAKVTPAPPVTNQTCSTPNPSQNQPKHNRCGTKNKENQTPAKLFKSEVPKASRPVKSKNIPLSNLAVRIMTTWYEKNHEHPYPSSDAVKVMTEAGGITGEQVINVFNYSCPCNIKIH